MGAARVRVVWGTGLILAALMAAQTGRAEVQPLTLAQS